MIKHPDTHKVLTTVTPDGKPHAIVCASLSMLGDDTILVADVFMHRTSDNLNNNPKIILSRTAPEFLERLLENEVPEINDGLITIHKIVRIPGERAKIAV